MKAIQFLFICFAAGAGIAFGQSYTGNLDTANCGTITGYAYNSNSQTQSVDIYDGTVFLTTVVADVSTGNPDSNHNGTLVGFSLTTPSTLKDNQVHSIYARYTGTTTNLGGDPRTLQCDATSPGYQYYFTDSFQSINSSNWTQNGSFTVLSGGGLNASSSGGGSLISKVAVQGPSSTNYEVNMTVTLAAGGGDYVSYARATSNAITGTGSYFSVELQNPTFGSTGACSATLAAYQSVSGTVTQLLSRPVACYNGMQIRTVILGTVAYIILDGETMWANSISVSTGMPGVGGRSMPSGNAVSLAMLGPWDNVAPSPVNSTTFATSVTSNGMFAQWQGAVDDPNGVGIALYAIERNDGAWFYTYDASFYDGTVAPSTTYSYNVIAQDYHRNNSTVSSFSITTPPAGAPDPRRVGVGPTGSYWGGAGEQIDLLSGNLNFSIPLIHAVGRGGLTANFNLIYNSQNWRVGTSATEQMGVDVGYGFGWQLMLGSLLPVYSGAADPTPVSYYLFTDSTGAQYRLNQNSGSIWSSTGSIFIWYDASANILHFRNGTFWVMGCASAGGEPDAGTLYPTIVEDTNGNQIIITYMAGASASWLNSSARIEIIEDARAPTSQWQQGSVLQSYMLSYATGTNGLSYLHMISTSVATTENWEFNITEGQPIYSPTGTSFGTTSLLTGLTNPNFYYSYNFTYDTSLNDGDLLKAQFPQGGALGWAYGNFTYLGGQTLRQVASRTQQSGTPVYSYTLTWPDSNNSVSLHTGIALDDVTSGTEKYWAFNPSGGTYAGLVSELQWRSAPGVTAPLPRDEVYTWASDPKGNAFVGTVLTTLDKGQAYQRQNQTVQTQDGYGNVLTTNEYDFGNLSTPARSYSSTYLYQNTTNGPAYQSLYIYDRLLTSKLTSVTPNVTLASNVYDQCPSGLWAVSGAPTEWDAVNYGTSTVLRGNVTQANAPGKTTNACYDATGNVGSQNDNNGHSVNASTSSATNFTLPDTLSPNGSSSLETAATYTGTGFLPASIAGPGQTTYDPTNSPNGTAAYTSYDSYGRVSYTLAPSQIANQAAGAQTTYSYSYTTTDAWSTTATTTNSNGSTHYTATILDGFGRTTSVISGMNNSPTSEIDTVYAPCACSPLGKMQKRTQPYAPPNASPPTTTYTYDALGRAINILLADGATQTTYVYQGNFTTVTDPAGNWKQYATDSFGNLVMVLEPDPTQNPVVGPPLPSTYPVTSAPSGTLLTMYTYDQYNHLTQVSMPRNTANGLKTQTRTFVYSPTTYSTLNLPALWLTSATNPESGTTSYTYNADGTLASKTDANGNAETYTYDAYQRLTGIPDRQQTFTYDTCPSTDTGPCTGTAGKLVESAIAVGVGSNQLNFQYDYTYTPAGKVSSKALSVQSAKNWNYYWDLPASGTLTASYVYDSEGVLSSLQYPANENYIQNPTIQTFTYALDAMERPTGMTDNLNNTWASGVTYNAANQPLYDGTATRTYNSLLQMTSMVATGMNMTYNYSSTHNNGQITSSVDAISGETVTYSYDALKRLVAAQGKNWTEGYTYDGYGNLTQMSPTGGAPSLSLTVALDSNNVPTNRINAAGVSYDNNGNQTAGFSGQNFAYDAANRLIAVSGSASAAFAYDAANMRVYSRNSSGTETIYFYGIDGKKLATYSYSIVTCNGYPAVQLIQTNANVYFLGKLISAEGNTVQVDRLGSVRSGGPGGLGHQAQYPYGMEYVTTQNNREKYATYTRDNATGLDYAMSRYYSSQWGRFLSPDPDPQSASLKSAETWNRYGYAIGDSINLVDPRGADPQNPDPGAPGNEPPFACDLFGGCNGCPNDLWDSGFGFMPMPGPLGPFCSFLPDDPPSGDLPAVSCSLTLESRPLLHGILKGGFDLHLFLVYSGPTGVVQVAEGLHPGSLLTATINGDSIFGDEDGTVAGPAVCGAIAILARDVQKINAAHITYHFWGPNSSSVMRYMLNSLSYLMSLFGPWYSVPSIILTFGGYYAPLPGVETPSTSGSRPTAPSPIRFHL